MKVYPTRESSLVLKHPIDGPLKVGGSEWRVDGFTCRMLTDRAVTSDAAEAWAPSAPPKPAAAPTPTISDIASQLSHIESEVADLASAKT